MSDERDHDALRWVIAILAALAIVALLAYARGEPGVGGRVPDPEDAAVSTIVVELR